MKFAIGIVLRACLFTIIASVTATAQMLPNRTLPLVPPNVEVSFSEQPTETDIQHFGVFEEPLVAMGKKPLPANDDFPNRIALTANTRPVISSLSVPSVLPMALGTIPTPMNFSITDNETPATNLILSGASSNTNLLPNSNIVFGSSGMSGRWMYRTVTLTPAQGQIGNTTVILTLSDGTLSASRSLNLVVYPVNVNSTVVVWGSDENLQALVPEEALTEVKAIAAGGSHCLVLKTDGTVLGLPSPWAMRTVRSTVSP